MTILDTFYILFKTNAEDIKKGTAEAKKATDDFQKSLNDTDKIISSLSSALLEVGVNALTAFAGFEGIKAGISQAYDLNLELDKTAKLTGFNAVQIQAWDQAFQRFGGTQGEFTQWFTSYSQFLQRTGGDTRQILPNLQALNRELRGLSDDQARQRFQQLAQAYGLPQNFFLALREAPEDFDKIIAKQTDLIKVTQQSETEARKFAQTWEDAGSGIVGVFTNIFNKIAPFLTKIGQIFNDVVIKDWLDYTSAQSATSPSVSTTSSSLNVPRNNPGDLRSAPGAQSFGGFAQFATLQQGIDAEQAQLQRYGQRGINTLRAIAEKWAPPNENDTESYIAGLVKSTGFDQNQTLDLSDPKVRAAVANAINRQEHGAAFGNLIGTAKDSLAAADSSSFNAAPSTSNTSHSIIIGAITIQTQPGADASGIAAALGDKLNEYRTVMSNWDDGGDR